MEFLQIYIHKFVLLTRIDARTLFWKMSKVHVTCSRSAKLSFFCKDLVFIFFKPGSRYLIGVNSGNQCSMSKPTHCNEGRPNWFSVYGTVRSTVMGFHSSSFWTLPTILKLSTTYILTASCPIFFIQLFSNIFIVI